MLAMLLAVLPLLSPAEAPAGPPVVIAPADAAKYVGKSVVVEGTMEQVVLSVNLTTHANFGGRYPNHVFTITIFKAKQSLFKGVKEHEGKRVRVRGVVDLYRGKPEIVLTEPSQLEYLE
jgi:DNA/RNA endonuclease YhcR with UshA esterase domain